MKNAKESIVHIAENRRARQNYIIEDTFECGISLFGAEVKSIREHRLNFADAYALLKDGEMFLIGLRIDVMRVYTQLFGSYIKVL